MSDLSLVVRKTLCEDEHLYFTQYFFKERHGGKFIVNWHHEYLAAAVEGVIDGDIKNLLITISPGSSKTEEVVINFMARGLAKNPDARFLHLSYSDDLALLNSQTAREIVRSEDFQSMWGMTISSDTKSKKRWNVEMDGRRRGGVYATSMSGQVTGFRAGHLKAGFQGAIIIDDPMKPEDYFSKVKVTAINRKLLTTIKSRRASPDTPIVVIMQRIGKNDPAGFILDGNVPGEWTHVNIPALIDSDYVASLPTWIRKKVKPGVKDAKGRFSYWEEKEPLRELLEMESGLGRDPNGQLMSRHVFKSQYQQDPILLGGNIIKGAYFRWYKPGVVRIKYRKIFCDTAQKTKEANDYSVFGCYGEGYDGNVYILDLIRGKWEAPELERMATGFWSKHAALDADVHGLLRQMVVEDKSSGTGLVQYIRRKNTIPIIALERHKDKFTRSQDALPYLELGMVYLPEDTSWTSDFVSECEAFTSDDTHDHDDQVDTLFDAVEDMLSSKNKLKTWEKL